MVPFYNTMQAFVDRSGKILRPWIQYLQQFTIAPPNIMSVTVGASPYSYNAKEPGNLFVSGGTITSIFLVRGAISIDVIGEKLIPVGVQDTVIVTYTVLPTIKFIPSYGQNTTS